MKTSKELPPNYEMIKLAFPKCEESKAVFCYGDTLHNPFGINITADLIYHEAIHTKQQGNDPARWWQTYCLDKEFRFSQELEAFQGQYRFVKRSVKDREMLNWFLNKLATSLSSELYGSLCEHSDARKYIKGVV